MILEIVVTALVAGCGGLYTGYRLGKMAGESEDFGGTLDVIDDVASKPSAPRPPYRQGLIDAPNAKAVGVDTLVTSFAGASRVPTYRILRDDGAVLIETRDGGKALRAWETLTSEYYHGPGVSFLHDGMVRGRVEPSA